MNSVELANRVAGAIGSVGMSFYFDPLTRARAKEVGLNSFEFYGLGRGGTLGDVDAEVVIEAFTFFHPRSVERMWTLAKIKAEPVATAQEYLVAAYAYADRTFGAIDPSTVANFARSAHKVAASVPPGRHLLFDGYERFDVPANPLHAAYLGAILMRELRGCVHIDAINEVGLSAVHAIYLEDPNLFTLHGYEEDETPDVKPEHRAQKVQAEILTTAMMAVLFDVLTDRERQEFADGAAAMFEALRQPVAVTV